MNRIELNKIKFNTLTLNRICGGVVSVSASGGGTDEVPDGYQMLIDNEDAYLIDSNDKIIVVPVEDEEVNLPSFTITKDGEDKLYYFEQGMNFEAWINSEYNTDGYEALSTFMWEYISNDGGYTALYDRSSLLHPFDNYPEDGWIYTTELFGNGGNAGGM